MATSAGFKQQCPSCEAMVPVRDDSLIGRKIDCPKCKYRFVVEAPAEQEPEEDDEPKSKKASKKGDAGSKPSKLKAKVPVDDDEEESSKPKKWRGGSPTVLGGGLAGAVGVLVLVFGALYFFVFSGSSGKRGGGAPSSDSGKPPPTDERVVQTAPVAKAIDITNLLPNDTRALVSIQVDKLLSTSFNKAALLTQGAFNPEDFELAYGFRLDDVQRILMALTENNGVFTVLLTAKPYDRQVLKDHLGLEAEPPVNGVEYFTVKGAFDAFSNMIIKGQRTREKMQVRYVDPQILVFADPVTMEKFLSTGGKPAVMTQAPAPGSTTPVAPAAAPLPAAPPAVGPAASPPAPAGPAGGTGAPKGFGGRRGGAPKGAEAAAPAAAPPPGGAAPASQPAVAHEPVGVSASYLTIRPELKALLDRIEKLSKQPIVMSVADALHPLVGEIAQRARAKLALAPTAGIIDVGLKTLEKKPELQQVKNVGFIVEAFNEEKTAMVVMLDVGTESTAKVLEETLKQPVELVGQALVSALGLEAGAAGAEAAKPKGPGAPAAPPNGGAAANAPLPVRLTRAERTILMTIDLQYQDAVYRRLLHEVEVCMVELRGAAEMVANRSRVHELADVIQAYVREKGHFPRGTISRQSDKGDLPPALRQSWLSDLLPFLQGDYKLLPREFDKSWQEGDNLVSGQILIPQFLCRTPPYFVHYPGVASPLAVTHFVGIAGVGLEAANFPANSAITAKKIGVFGYDRVTLPAPKTFTRAPIVAQAEGKPSAKKEEIKKDQTAIIRDGLDQTIVAVQVPSEAANPWIAGGGGTVRGVSEESDAVEPFVCLDYEGKRGTFAIMADGKVRFVPANLPPETFRALCTIAGGDRVANLDRLCPVVPRPEGTEAELKSKGRKMQKGPAEEDKKTYPTIPLDWPVASRVRYSFSARFVREPAMVPAKNMIGADANIFQSDVPVLERRYMVRVSDLGAWSNLPTIQALLTQLQADALSYFGNPNLISSSGPALTPQKVPYVDMLFTGTYNGLPSVINARILTRGGGATSQYWILFSIGTVEDDATRWAYFVNSFQVL